MRASAPSLRVLASGLEFPEGPAVSGDGNVYLVEIRAGRISCWDGDRAYPFAEVGGGPNGSAFGPDGHLYVANSGGFEWDGPRPVGRPQHFTGGWIERVDSAGSVEVIARDYEGERFEAPNDLTFDREGNLYFTDPGYKDYSGRLFCLLADGALMIAGEGYKYCNGLAFTGDGARLYLAESYTRRVLIYDVEAPGRLSGERLFAQLPEGHYPDGICVDAEGQLLVAGAGGGTIHVFDGSGRAVDQIPSDDPLITNLAFGGDDNRTLYATESSLGRLIALDWPTAGQPLPHVGYST